MLTGNFHQLEGSSQRALGNLAAGPAGDLLKLRWV